MPDVIPGSLNVEEEIRRVRVRVTSFKRDLTREKSLKMERGNKPRM